MYYQIVYTIIKNKEKCKEGITVMFRIVSSTKYTIHGHVSFSAILEVDNAIVNCTAQFLDNGDINLHGPTQYSMNGKARHQVKFSDIDAMKRQARKKIEGTWSCPDEYVFGPLEERLDFIVYGARNYSLTVMGKCQIAVRVLVLEDGSMKLCFPKFANKERIDEIFFFQNRPAIWEGYIDDYWAMVGKERSVAWEGMNDNEIINAIVSQAKPWEFID